MIDHPQLPTPLPPKKEISLAIQEGVISILHRGVPPSCCRAALAPVLTSRPWG